MLPGEPYKLLSDQKPVHLLESTAHVLLEQEVEGDFKDMSKLMQLNSASMGLIFLNSLHLNYFTEVCYHGITALS